MQEFMYRDKKKLEYEVYDHTGNNWSQRNSNEGFKGKIDSLQKTATLRTSHILREVLQAETWSPGGGDHHWLKRRRTREEKACGKRQNNILCFVDRASWYDSCK